jgi:hypothetical protein
VASPPLDGLRKTFYTLTWAAKSALSIPKKKLLKVEFSFNTSNQAEREL